MRSGFMAVRPITLAMLSLLGPAALGSISHGPVLGSLATDGVAIWVRTTVPQRVTARLLGPSSGRQFEQTVTTQATDDNTHSFRFSGLEVDSAYRYRIVTEDGAVEGRFRTRGAGGRETRIVFGSCYDQARMAQEGGIVFRKMRERNADAVIFLGDFPYSSAGRLAELRSGHRLIRENGHFSALASSVPLYAIWDDHDFGENDADGSNRYKDEALQAFAEYWPNPENKDRGEKGIYTSFLINDVEVFLLDTRYHASQSKAAPALLGERQFAWLCQGLAKSEARYKLIASGVPLASDNRDGWSGDYFQAERDRLFSCIAENRVSGVVMISGDLHRAEVNRFRIGSLLDGGGLYDFTSSPLKARSIRRQDPAGGSLLYIYEKEGSLFAQLSFSSGPGPLAVEFQLISPDHGLIKRIVLNDDDLGMNPQAAGWGRQLLFMLALIMLLAWFVLRRRVR